MISLVPKIPWSRTLKHCCKNIPFLLNFLIFPEFCWSNFMLDELCYFFLFFLISWVDDPPDFLLMSRFATLPWMEKEHSEWVILWLRWYTLIVVRRKDAKLLLWSCSQHVLVTSSFHNACGQHLVILDHVIHIYSCRLPLHWFFMKFLCLNHIYGKYVGTWNTSVFFYRWMIGLC